MTDNWYNLIEDYNLGKLPDTQRLQFEAAMAADSALALAVAQQRTEWEAGELLAEKMLREEIRETFEKHQESSKPRVEKYWKWILAFAMILIMAWVVFFRNQEPVIPANPSISPEVLPQPDAPMAAQPAIEVPQSAGPAQPDQPRFQSPRKTPNYKALALAAYRRPEGLVQTRGQDGGDSLSLAMEAFDRREFKRAIKLLTPLPDGAGQEGLALRGHAHFLAKDYAKARNDFSNLLAGGLYIRDAQWFGLLAEMAATSSGHQNLMEQLQIIRQDNRHPYQKEAAALWSNLNQ